MRTPYALAAALALAAAACTAERTIGIKYRSEAIRRSVTDVRVFVFAPVESGGMAPSCEELDPQGRPYGDAEARTGRVATYKHAGAPRDTIAEFDDLPNGQYTLVIEAWGPGCAMTTESSDSMDPACALPRTDGLPVMRAYECVPLVLSGSANRDVDIPLRTFAAIGSEMRVPAYFPVDAIAYSEAAPLPVVDGLLARDRFMVQLLNQTSEGEDGVKVHWLVKSGSGSIDGAEVGVTSDTTVAGERGIAAATVRAGAAASTIDEGKIVVAAYAPGYEDAPIELVARALRGVELEMTEHILPRTRIDLAGTLTEFQPVIVDDLDLNGRGDVVVLGGTIGRCSGSESTHTVGVLYGRDDGTFQAAYSAPTEQQARAMATARIDAAGRRALLVSTANYCDAYTATSFGMTYVIRSPTLEIWNGLDETPPEGDDTLRGQVTRATQTTRCTGTQCAQGPEPLVKAAIAIDANDIDGDGVDEIAMSRCSHVYATVGGQLSPVECHGDLTSRTDSELVLMTPDVVAGTVTGFHERAILPETGNDGGYREVRLTDISGDGSLDLVASTQVEVTVVCGRRNMPDTGFGFAVNAQRVDASLGFGQGFSLATGRFNGDHRFDAVTGGGLRISGKNAGIRLNPGTDCGFEDGAESLLTGPRSAARGLLVRAADLNFDGWDDVLVLQRETRQLASYFGSGTNRLARGPSIALPSGVAGELGLFVEYPGEDQVAIAATTGPDENVVFTLRIRPARR